MRFMITEKKCLEVESERRIFIAENHLLSTYYLLGALLALSRFM